MTHSTDQPITIAVGGDDLTMHLPYEAPYRTVVDAACRIAYEEDRYMSAWSFVAQWLDGTTVWRSTSGSAVAHVYVDGTVLIQSA